MASEGGKKLAGKIALVTGASKGIGKAVAAAYAREGARVAICARDPAKLERAENEIAGVGDRVFSVSGDVGNAGDARRIVAAVYEKFGAIDVLVNNASVLGPRVPVVSYPLSAWEEVMRINATGPFLMIQESLKLMLARRQGSIINVSSGVGRIGRARWGAYAASKFALEGLTQVVADEVCDYGIRANVVNPGPTRTEMRAQAYPDEDPLSLPTPDEITGVFVYLASDAAAGVSGKAFEARDWPRR